MEESITTAEWDVDIHNAETTCMTMIMERVWGDSGKGKRFKSVVMLALFIYIAGPSRSRDTINKNPQCLFWFIVSHLFHKRLSIILEHSLLST